MDKEKYWFKDSQITILGICIAIGMISGTWILSKGIVAVKEFTNQVITVTGSSKQQVTSDYVIWKARFKRQAKDLPSAFEQIQADLQKVNTYLESKGIDPKDLFIAPVDATSLYVRDLKGYSTNEIDYYLLTQEIELRSHDIEKIDKIANSASELIQQGLLFFVDSPRYLYTKLPELKLKLLAEATEEAKRRATTMVEASGSKLGTIRGAKMGVFQITPINSTDISDYGMNDTSSLEKNVLSVVHVTFAINPS
ncbi:MAG: hypothetical protein K0S74_1438 [Chlamydiales bacterium]|nr:hypothetical protein [Chlamydiales bacterium]